MHPITTGLNDNIISGVFYIQTFDNSGRLVLREMNL